MPFSNPIIGGSSVLVRPAIRSPDFVAGSSGWSINRDGSAELNNVTIRGDFATGSAGGPDSYLTINDGTDRTTIDFWNAAGTNHGYINSPVTGGGVPQIGANSGLYDLGGSVPGRSRLLLTAGGVQLERVRESDQAAQGGQVLLGAASGVLDFRQPGGVATGGAVTVGTSDTFVSYQIAGVPDSGIRAASDGVHTFGSFVSDIGWSTLVGTGFTLDEFRMDRWGGSVHVHIRVTRTGANIAAGAFATVTLATVTSAGNLPASQTSMAGQWAGGVAGVFFDSAGLIGLRYLTTALNTGDILRCDVSYFKG